MNPASAARILLPSTLIQWLEPGTWALSLQVVSGMSERTAFAAELRRARERRGLSLDALAEQTKVSATLFAGLERADLSRWPSGIFRRAFIRSYAVAVGLDPEETVARFSRLFHDPAADPKSTKVSKSKPTESPADILQAEHQASLAAAAPEAIDDEPGSRLALEHARVARGYGAVARRLASGLLDVSIAVMPAALVALVVGAQWFWPVVACVAIAGHLACVATTGTTPGAWLMGQLAAPRVLVAPARAERRRAEGDTNTAPRRHVPRYQSARSASHAHRVRH